MLRTWSGVREDERGSADPVDDLQNSDRVRGDKGSTGRGFRHVDLVGNGDGVANLVDTSLKGKGWNDHRYCETTPSPASTEISGFRCWPSRTSRRPSLHGREVDEGDTFDERRTQRRDTRGAAVCVLREGGFYRPCCRAQVEGSGV